jgi:hypothetical protein
VPPAPDAPPVIDTGLQGPAPDDANGVPGQPQQAIKVGYTKQLWNAIRGLDIHGNDALDSLAQPSAIN